MLVATLGLVFIAYRASAVSIEIADAKINLSSAIATVKDIKSDLEKENERLKKANEELQAKLEGASGDVAKIIRDPAIGIDLKEILKGKPLGGENLSAYRIDPKAFEQLDSKIQRAQTAIDSKGAF
jgi:FtsZ-binding cell division protein ZapB